MSDRQITLPATDYVSSLIGGEHGVMFYTSKQEMRIIHLAFIKSGLQNNWGVVYTIPGSFIDEVRQEMVRYGIDVRKYEEDGSLFIQSRGCV